MKYIISFCLLYLGMTASAQETSLVEALRQGDYKLKFENVRFGFGYNSEKVCSDFNEDSECVDARFIFVAEKDLGVEPYSARSQSSPEYIQSETRHEVKCQVAPLVSKKTYEADVRELGLFADDVQFRYVYAVDPKQDEWEQRRNLEPEFLYFNFKPQYAVSVIDVSTVVETKNFPYQVCWSEEYSPVSTCYDYVQSRRIEFEAIVTPRVRLKFKCESAVASNKVVNPEFTIEQLNRLFKNGYSLSK